MEDSKHSVPTYSSQYNYSSDTYPTSYNSSYSNQSYGTINQEAAYQRPSSAELDRSAQISQGEEEEPFIYENDRQEQSTFKDKFFLILFALQFIGFWCFSVFAIFSAVFDADGYKLFNFNVDGNTIMILLGLLLPGVILPLQWVFVVEKLRGNAFKVSFIFYNLLLLGMIGVMPTVYTVIAAAIIVPFGLIFYCCFRSRIPFTEEILHSSAQALKKNFSAFYYGIFILFLGAVYTFFIVTGASTAIYLFVDVPTADNIPTGFYWLAYTMAFFLLWTIYTFYYIFYVVVAGTIGSWWYTPLLEKASSGAFHRATAKSLGSVAFAALVLVTVTILRTMARSILRSKGNSQNILVLCLLLVLYCIFSMIESLLKFLNSFALVQVALYGKSFIEASKATFSLVSTTGIAPLIHYDLTGFVVFAGVMISTLLSVIIVFLVQLMFFGNVFTVINNGSLVAALFFTFIASMFTSSFFISSLTAANNTTFVLWAEDPAAMEANRPETFNSIMEARSKAIF